MQLLYLLGGYDMKNIPFTKPYVDETIISAVSDCLESRWITTGNKVIELQTWIEDNFHVKKSFCVNSIFKIIYNLFITYKLFLYYSYIESFT